ncbi:MAG: hypothetical protein AVDCRST_MAG38-781 [uncultured Solirubrobacteraceae bacterium]|uniref:Glycosyl transferase family 1 domain-containing protein n=1 Tax=uncultured Solirubrobacteraceae bacterium TaxID=1162706 RepID=A0A6J4RGH0_9ACTN|nr:MAG: hypothetical protein AVDCRST_MAG38-781 [uncultured Solirubrobacteraceae bacterium]
MTQSQTTDAPVPGPRLDGLTVAIAAISFGGGGAERQAALWGHAVAARGAEVLLLSLEETRNGYALPPSARLLTVGKQRRRDTLKALRHLRKLAQLSDVVVAFQPYMGLLCTLAGLRDVVIVTGQDPRFFADTSRVPTSLFRLAFGRARAATAPSAGLIDCHRAARLNPGGPWLHVPNIVDESAVAGADSRSGVLFVGRLVAEKQPSLALRAAAAAGLPISFLGTGPLLEDLRAEARRLGAESSVRFLGFDPEPWKHYAGHRVLVVTSRYETFANVIVEALATGMPVVSVDCDFGPREILRGARFSRLVPEDESTIAQALAAVAGRPPTAEERLECEMIAGRYHREALEPSIADAVRAGLAA